MNPRLKFALPLVAALAVWGLLIGLKLFSANYLYGTDGYYHVRISQVMAEQGLVLESFPYATESIWAERFFDKEWLFHVWLVPFLALGLITGAHLAILLLNLLIVGAIWYAARQLGIRQPGWLILFLPFFAYTALFERLVLCRPHLVSIIILFLAIGAMTARRPLLLAIVSLLYALSYTGHWQLLGLVFIYDVLYALLDDEGKRRPALSRRLPLLVPAAIGMLAGEILHPQFPDNMIGLYIQNVQVLWQYWQGSTSDFLFQMRPDEMRPWPIADFLFYLWPILLSLLALAIYAWRQRLWLNRNLIFLAICTAGYLFMTWRSKRFAEYLVAVAVIFMGLCWQHFNLGEKLHWKGWKGIGATLLALVVVGTAITLGREVAANWSAEGKVFNRPLYEAATQWLDEHAEPGEIVFATSWSDNPFLWFGAPEQHYLVFLDPYFIYARSPERFEAWHRTRLGTVEDPLQNLREIFNADYVFTQRNENFALLIEALDNARGVEKVQDKRDYMLYRLPKSSLTEGD